MTLPVRDSSCTLHLSACWQWARRVVALIPQLTAPVEVQNDFALGKATLCINPVILVKKVGLELTVLPMSTRQILLAYWGQFISFCCSWMWQVAISQKNHEVQAIVVEWTRGKLFREYDRGHHCSLRSYRMLRTLCTFQLFLTVLSIQ
jgi:hypothetical protein